MEWVCPAIARLPVRGVADAFAPIEYVTTPGPLPLTPALIPIHAALGVAVHAQPAAAVTVTVPVPPPLSIVAFAGEIANEQTGVGSVGELSPQLMVDNNPATDAQRTSLAFMTHLRCTKESIGPTGCGCHVSSDPRIFANGSGREAPVDRVGQVQLICARAKCFEGL